MKDNAVFGGLIGAVAILLFTFATYLLLADIFALSIFESTAGIIISGAIILIAPFSGGFLAGLIGQSDPRRAGLLAGLLASLIVFVAWLAMTGLSIQTILSGLVIVFVWIVLARLASGFAIPKTKES